jgi:hypothetical protein
MNRTRKIVAAGIGAAVIVVILAMVLMVPSLHTQTPVSTAPPTNGGTGGGGSGGTGTGGGSGSGNNTLANCNVTGNEPETGDGNVTDSSVTGVGILDGNQTNETGTHDGGACGATSGDHDSKGDQESEAHASPNARGLADELSADVLALVPFLGGALAAAGSALASLGRSAAGFLGGLAASFSVYGMRR